MYAVALITFLIAVVLILLIFRLAFGRKLRMPGGRTRQQRLGLVEAFDLDRQRQLLIVRRDNTEHLIMIGGPNDLLIEAEIIRGDGRLRDKETREPAGIPGQNLTGIPWPSPGVAPTPIQPFTEPPLVPEPVRMEPVAAEKPLPRTEPVYRPTPAPERFAPVEGPAQAPQEPFPVSRREAERSLAAQSAPPVPPRPTPAQPLPRTPAYPMPPKRPLPPLGTLGNRPTPTREQTAPGSPAAGPAAAFPRAPITTPFLRPLPQRQGSTEATREEPTAPSFAPETAVPQPQAEQVQPPPPPTPEPTPIPVMAEEPVATPPSEPNLASEAKIAESVDSLEEEMAKLLGRSSTDS